MKNLFSILFIGIVLALAHGCSDDDYPVPPASTVPKFTAEIDNDAFAPATATFTNESVIPDRAGEVTFLWNFGDGTSSQEENPQHLFEAPGAYVVNLVVVTTESMEINEYSQTVVIKDPNAGGIRVFFTDGGTVFSALINESDPVRIPIGITGLQDVYGMAIDTVNDKLYVADFDGAKIIVSDLDGSNQQDFRTNIGDPDAVAIDYKENKLYWDTGSGIRRADIGNSDVSQFEEFVTGQANDPEGISIDTLNRMLYWNNYDGGVWRKSLAGGAETEIIPGTGGGGSMLVIGDRIFYDDYVAAGDIRLKSANLNGSGIATVATGISRVVYGLAYDKAGDKVYWVDRNQSKIMRSNLDGSDPEPWHTGTSARGLVIGKEK